MRFGMGFGLRHFFVNAVLPSVGRVADSRSTDDEKRTAKVPPKSILSRDFRYVNSANTSVRRTFDRIRREQKAEKEALSRKLHTIGKVRVA